MSHLPLPHSITSPPHFIFYSFFTWSSRPSPHCFLLRASSTTTTSSLFYYFTDQQSPSAPSPTPTTHHPQLNARSSMDITGVLCPFITSRTSSWFSLRPPLPRERRSSPLVATSSSSMELPAVASSKHAQANHLSPSRSKHRGVFPQVSRPYFPAKSYLFLSGLPSFE